jgi:hypothetical protein
MISTCHQRIKTGDPTASICDHRAALVGLPGKVIEGPILRENIAFVELFPLETSYLCVDFDRCHATFEGIERVFSDEIGSSHCWKGEDAKGNALCV